MSAFILIGKTSRLGNSSEQVESIHLKVSWIMNGRPKVRRLRRVFTAIILDKNTKKLAIIEGFE